MAAVGDKVKQTIVNRGGGLLLHLLRLLLQLLLLPLLLLGGLLRRCVLCSWVLSGGRRALLR